MLVRSIFGIAPSGHTSQSLLFMSIQDEMMQLFTCSHFDIALMVSATAVVFETSWASIVCMER